MLASAATQALQALHKSANSSIRFRYIQLTFKLHLNLTVLPARQNALAFYPARRAVTAKRLLDGSVRLIFWYN